MYCGENDFRFIKKEIINIVVKIYFKGTVYFGYPFVAFFIKDHIPIPIESPIKPLRTNSSIDLNGSPTSASKKTFVYCPYHGAKIPPIKNIAINAICGVFKSNPNISTMY